MAPALSSPAAPAAPPPALAPPPSPAAELIDEDMEVTIVETLVANDDMPSPNAWP